MMVPPRLQIRTSRIQWSHLRYSLEQFSWWGSKVFNKVCATTGMIILFSPALWEVGKLVLERVFKELEHDRDHCGQPPVAKYQGLGRGVSSKQGLVGSRSPPCKSSRRGGRRWRCPLCPTGCEKGQGDHWEGKCLRLQISAWIHLSYIVQLPP